MGGSWQDQVLPDPKRPTAVSKERCADGDRSMSGTRPIIGRATIGRATPKGFFVRSHGFLAPPMSDERNTTLADI